MYSGTPPYGATPRPMGQLPAISGTPPPYGATLTRTYEAVQPPHGVNPRPWLAVEPLGASMGPVTPSQPQVRRSQFQGNTRQSRVNLSLSRVEPSQHQSVRACVRLFSRSPRTQPNQMISLYIYVINADTFLDGPTYWIACWIAYKFCLGLRKAT
jgi:hypothetical protein